MFNEVQGQKIKERLRAIGISQTAFSALAEINIAELSLALRGMRVPDRVQPRVERALEDIETIIRTPNSRIPNWKSAASINESLANLAEIRAKENRPTEPIDFEKIRIILSAPTVPKVRSDNVEAGRVLAGQEAASSL
jgi:hypothetical protein